MGTPKLGKIATAVLEHMRKNPETVFLALCTRDENAADKLVSLGLAEMRSEEKIVNHSRGYTTVTNKRYRLTDAGKRS